jgi:hypothetical protein
MPRNVTLGQLVQDLRLEAGHAPDANLGKNVRASLARTLQRTQEFLYQDHDWTFLKTYEDFTLAEGQVLYDFPDTIDMERVERIEVKWADAWHELARGIDGTQYSALPSQNLDPAERWEIRNMDGAEQIEIWPPPATDLCIARVYGIKKLSPLVADADRCDLDSNMIVLFAAAEILARQKSKDADAKRAVAQEYYARLRGRPGTGPTKISFAGQQPSGRRPGHIRVAYVR